MYVYFISRSFFVSYHLYLLIKNIVQCLYFIHETHDLDDVMFSIQTVSFQSISNEIIKKIKKKKTNASMHVCIITCAIYILPRLNGCRAESSSLNNTLTMNSYIYLFIFETHTHSHRFEIVYI